VATFLVTPFVTSMDRTSNPSTCPQQVTMDLSSLGTHIPSIDMSATGGGRCTAGGPRTTRASTCCAPGLWYKALLLLALVQPHVTGSWPHVVNFQPRTERQSPRSYDPPASAGLSSRHHGHHHSFQAQAISRPQLCPIGAPLPQSQAIPSSTTPRAAAGATVL